MRVFISSLVLLFFVSVGWGQSITTTNTAPFCSGTGVVLTVTPATGISGYQWVLSGTDIPGATSQSYVANAPGRYTVKLNRDAPLSDTTIGGAGFLINAAPAVPGFSFTTNNQCASAPFNFVVTNPQAGVTYTWDFGDGVNTVSGANVLHLYNDNNSIGNGSYTYTVRVVARSSAGCIAQSPFQQVTVAKKPSAKLGGNPSVTDYNGKPYFVLCTTNPQATLTFYNQSTTASTNTSYLIRWGDGSPNYTNGNSWATGTSGQITHTYAVGLYQLTFIVSSASCVDSAKYFVFVGSNPTGSISSPGSTIGCTGDLFSFPFANISNNPPGTEYIIVVNDQTDTVRFTQENVPANFTHVFNKTSCGASFNNSTTNTFTISYLFVNPCGETPGTIGGIRISTKPKANISVSPSDTVCQNSIVTFTNIGDTGFTVPNVGNGACLPSKSIWEITPLSGWTRVNGSLGSDNGDQGNPDNWISGTSPIAINFQVPGVYQVKLKVGNSRCGKDSIIKTICVNSLPVANFSVDQSIGCSPLNVNTSNNVTPNTCGNNTYRWSVSYQSTNGCLPDTSNFTFTGGTNASSVNPKFQFNSPGVYTISLIATAPGGTCSSIPFTQTVTVKGKPVVSILPIASVCQGQAISPAATANCYTSSATYAWTFPGAVPATSNALSPGNVIFNTTGTVNIGLGVTNECGTSTDTRAVVINPTPTINPIRDTGYCVNQPTAPINFTGAIPGTVFNWTNSNTSIGLPASGTGNIAAFTPGTAGTAAITVTPTLNGCTGTPVTFIITVNALPPAPTVSNVSYCVGETAVPVTATATGSNTLNWYNSQNGGAPLPSAPTPSTASPATITYYVSQVAAGSVCESNRVALTVTIKPVPVITGAATNPSACGASNGSITLSGLTASQSYTGSYVFGGNTVPFTQQASGTGTIVISNLASGAYSNITVTLNGCASAPIGPFNLSDPSSPASPNAVASTPRCSGQTITLEATGGSANATYNWSGPNGFSSNLQNTSIPSATTAATGNYTVSVTVAGCTSPATTVSVIVDSTPAIPIIPAVAPVCTGNSISLSASTNSTLPVSWSWSGPNSFSATQQNPTISNATVAMSGTYNVTVTATSSSCSSSASIPVTVNVTPAINISDSSNPTSCNATSPNGSITLSGVVSGSTYLVRYKKNGIAQTATISATSTSMQIAGLSAGIYSDITVELNGCASNAVGPVTLEDPNPPATPVLTTNAPVCSGTSLTFTVTNPVAGAVYQWSGPLGFAPNGTNTTVSINAATNASGDYSVTATVNGCTSAAGTIFAEVRITPDPPVVTSPVIYCQRAIATALTAVDAGGNTLKWYTTATGGTGSSSAPVPSTLNVGSTIYYVSQTSAENCEGDRASIEVIVNATPVVTDQQTTICSGASFTLTPTGAPANTLYSWQAPVVTGGITGGIAGNNASSFTGALSNPTDQVQTATYMVTPKTGSCAGTPFQVAVTVNPAPRVTFAPAAAQVICSGESTAAVTLSSTTAGASISWTCVPPSATTITGVAITGSNSIPVQTLVNLTTQPIILTYTAIATTTGTTACPGEASLYTITVNPKPFIEDTALVVCSGNPFSYAPSPAAAPNIIPAGTLYRWTVNSNSGITGQQAQINPQSSIDQTLVNNGNTPQQLVYSIVPVSGAVGNCEGMPFTLTVTVNPTPDISATPATQTICSGNNASIAISSSVAGTSFSWTVNSPAEVTGASNGSGNAINQTLSNSSTVPQTVTYSIRSSNASGGVQCDGATTTVTVIVNPTAVVSNTPLSQDVCNGQSSAAITWTSATPGATFSWTATTTTGVTGFTQSGTGNLDPMTLTNTGDATLPLIYSVTTILESCPGAAVDYTINVRPDAKARISFPADTACWPFALNIQNTSPLTAATNYIWYANNTALSNTVAFPGYTINGPGDSVDIKLAALSSFGCRNDSITHRFYTKPSPLPAFSVVPRAGCGPLTVAFSNQTALLDSFTYSWNFGNGSTTNFVNPTPVTFLASPDYVDTIYYISLTARNECAAVTQTDSVLVYPGAKARFGVPTTFGCSPFTLPITNSSLGGPSTFYWDFGNGQKDTTTSTGVLNYIYYTNVVDTFTLMLIAENQCSRDTQLIDIRVAPNSIQPQVSISAPELFGCVAHTVNFVNSSIGATSFTWNFDDGTPPVVTNNTQFVVPHTFNTAGTFNVRIDMTNGCSDTFITRQIVVYPKPLAAFSTAGLYCLGDTVRVNNSSGNATNYRWFWGDGQSVGGFEPTHLYAVAGSYTILLRAEQTNAGGLVCFDTVSHPVNILVQPDARIQTNIAAVNCAPFTFNGTAPGIINESVTWYINDTTVSPSTIIQNGINAQYTFNRPGTFTIKMVAVNAAGCRDSSVRTVTVRGTPIAGFTPLNVTVCVRDTIISYQNTTTFNDFGPLTYRWLVDGVQYATTGNFTHRYTTPPNVALPNAFTTRLIATNAVGCSDTATGVLRMSPNPKAAFNVVNPNACVPFVPTVVNSSQNADHYQWFLNGVLVDTNRIPSITIALPSTAYSIRLVASNQFNCKPDTVSISFVSRIKPKASFRLNDTLGCTGILNVVTFNNTTNATSYRWDWGDATPGSAFLNPTHLYNVLGQYRITLVASDGVCNDTTAQLVSVANKPVVNFSANNLRTCDTARIQFTNLTTNADAYLWTFSNGGTSTDVDPYVLLAPSTTPYTVKLVASNVYGCKDSLIKTNLITAIVPPFADFFISPSPVISIPNYSFDFINTTTDNVNYTYQWNLGDGTVGNTRDMSRKYADTGSYPVRLIVFDNTTGCPDTVIKVARIEGQPGYLYVPNAFYPNSLQSQFRTFKPIGKGLASYQFQVFDAWGKLLFQSNELDAAGSPVAGWDGTFKGNPMPQDAYAWRIVAKFRNGRQWEGMSYGNNNNSTPGHTFGTVTLFR